MNNKTKLLIGIIATTAIIAFFASILFSVSFVTLFLTLIALETVVGTVVIIKMPA